MEFSCCCRVSAFAVTFADITNCDDVIAEQRMGIEGVNSDTDPRDRIAHFVVRVGIPDSAALDRLVAKLKQIPNVFQVRRSA